jgi:hypothetical protein
MHKLFRFSLLLRSQGGLSSLMLFGSADNKKRLEFSGPQGICIRQICAAKGTIREGDTLLYNWVKVRAVRIE